MAALPGAPALTPRRFPDGLDERGGSGAVSLAAPAEIRGTDQSLQADVISGPASSNQDQRSTRNT
jgi:hypothetical protein